MGGGDGVRDDGDGDGDGGGGGDSGVSDGGGSASSYDGDVGGGSDDSEMVPVTIVANAKLIIHHNLFVHPSLDLITHQLTLLEAEFEGGSDPPRQP